MSAVLTGIGAEECWLLLAQGVPLLTSNQRRQQYVHEAYASYQQRQGRSVWPSASIQPWSVWWQLWQQECWLGGANWGMPTRRLSAFEARLCWQQIIERDPASAHLLRPQEAARLAEQAWNWHRQYRLQVESLESTEEYQQLLLWSQQYHQLLTDLPALDDVAWFDALLAQLQQGQGQLPSRMILSGFADSTPQQQEFFLALSQRGVELHLLNEQAENPQIQLQACQDEQAELAAAVDWAASRAGQQLAIVVPDLSLKRAALVRLLDDRFHPELRQQPARVVHRCYNLSLGLALNQQPVVQLALSVLKLAGSYRLDLAELEVLVLSPYWRAVKQLDWSRWLRQWRDSCPQQLLKSDFLAYLSEPERQSCAPLLELLNWVWPKSSSALEWAAAFAALLEREVATSVLNSPEFQAWQQLSEQLSALARLSFIQTKLNASNARRLLVDLCQNCIFQPQTLGLPWLQVLGPLEALGGQFEAVRFIGLSQDAWPTMARPQPFLPLIAQKRHRLPHVDAERERQHCQLVLQQIAATSSELVLTWPQQRADRHLQPSRLLPSALVLADVLAAPSLAENQRQQPLVWQELQDETGPAWLADEQPRRLIAALEWQIRCPLAGFVFGRLQAQAYPKWSTELNARQRGTLVHAILQAFWAQTKTQQRLLALTPAELQQQLQQRIAASITRFNQQTPGWLTGRRRSLLAQQLQLSLSAWLEVERQRPLEFEVQELEQQQRVQLEGLEFSARLDRLDKLADGRMLLIDYKTGLGAHFSQWLPDASTDGWEELKALSKRKKGGFSSPQLPCYSLFWVPKPENLAAIAFARVRPKADENGFIALDAMQALQPKADKNVAWIEDMQPLYQYWRYQLQQLCQSYKAGAARLVLSSIADLDFADDVLPVLRLDEALAQQAMAVRVSAVKPAQETQA